MLTFDEALGSIRIEPGVSFGSLARFLQDAGSRFLPPTTGSHSETSVVGNVLERGLGKGLYEDMAGQALAFDVVMPSGEMVCTGPGGQVAGAVAVASGPDLRGLFVQSNLGVVVAMDFCLHPAPRWQQLVWTRLATLRCVEPCIDALRPILQRRDPWFRPELVTAERSKAQGVAIASSGWLAGIRLWADDEADLAHRRALAVRTFATAGATTAEAEPIQPGDRVALGDGGLQSAYAAKPGGMPPDPDPDRDGCGVRWVAPIVPMRGHAVADAAQLLSDILQRHGFSPSLSLRAMDGRTVKVVAGLFYDRDEPEADARAEVCAEDVHRALNAAGLLPYRLGIADTVPFAAGDSGRLRFLQAVKRISDPAGILSRGRYIVEPDGE